MKHNVCGNATKAMQTLYAIQHKPSGNFMPARMFKQAGSGWSWWEPTETRSGYLPHDPNPRLFYSIESARNALGQWLRGPLRRQSVPSACGYNELGFDERTWVRPCSDAQSPTRVRGHMRIVVLELHGLDKK